MYYIHIHSLCEHAMCHNQTSGCKQMDHNVAHRGLTHAHPECHVDGSDAHSSASAVKASSSITQSIQLVLSRVASGPKTDKCVYGV